MNRPSPLVGCIQTVHRGTCGVFAAILAGALLGHGAPVHANLVITATFDSTITSDPNAANIENTINQAIQFYQSTFTNPINVTIKFSEMSSGLGQSSWFFYFGGSINYSKFRSALGGQPTDATKATALAFLPPTSTNPVTNVSAITLKTANIRALGISGSFPPGTFSDGYTGDGEIGLNTHITDIGSPGTSGLYSLFATTEHEIDEVLGLGSALPGITNPFPQDLYRYDQNGNRSFTSSTSATAYFSLDGTTRLAQFNQTGSGDYGDWQSSPRPNGVPAQVQDAFATQGAHPVLAIGSPEVIALDAIGYDLVPVPEPSSVLLVGAGALLFAGCGWWRRKKPVADAVPSV